MFGVDDAWNARDDRAERDELQKGDGVNADTLPLWRRKATMAASFAMVVWFILLAFYDSSCVAVPSVVES